MTKIETRKHVEPSLDLKSLLPFQNSVARLAPKLWCELSYCTFIVSVACCASKPPTLEWASNDRNKQPNERVSNEKLIYNYIRGFIYSDLTNSSFVLRHVINSRFKIMKRCSHPLLFNTSWDLCGWNKSNLFWNDKALPQKNMHAGTYISRGKLKKKINKFRMLRKELK